MTCLAVNLDALVQLGLFRRPREPVVCRWASFKNISKKLLNKCFLSTCEARRTVSPRKNLLLTAY